MVAQPRLIVTLYVHCLPYCNLNSLLSCTDWMFSRRTPSVKECVLEMSGVGGILWTWWQLNCTAERRSSLPLCWLQFFMNCWCAELDGGSIEDSEISCKCANWEVVISEGAELCGKLTLWAPVWVSRPLLRRNDMNIKSWRHNWRWLMMSLAVNRYDAREWLIGHVQVATTAWDLYTNMPCCGLLLRRWCLTTPYQLTLQRTPSLLWRGRRTSVTAKTQFRFQFSPCETYG